MLSQPGKKNDENRGILLLGLANSSLTAAKKNSEGEKGIVDWKEKKSIKPGSLS